LLTRGCAVDLVKPTVHVSYAYTKNAEKLAGPKSTSDNLPAIIVLRGTNPEGPSTDTIEPKSVRPDSIVIFETVILELDADLETFCS
jgi:hypothetical protein